MAGYPWLVWVGWVCVDDTAKEIQFVLLCLSFYLADLMF